MKTFSEFTGNDTQATSMSAFPTFEEVSQGKEVTSTCLTEKMNIIQPWKDAWRA